MTGGEDRGPLIVTATFGAIDHGWLEGLRRRHFPVDRNHVPVHLTLFHHLPPGIERELAGRLAEFARGPAPPAAIAGLLDLGGGTAFRVESEELEDIRAELADAFRTLLVPQDRAGWRPHVTIQNKVAPRDARALQDDLRATEMFPKPLAIRGLASWRYCGGPWEALKAYPFRG